VSSLSSLYKSRLVANQLKEWIELGKFFITAPVESLPTDTEVKPMKVTSEIKFVNGFMRDTITCNANDAITEVAEKIVTNNQDHVPVVDEKGKLVGIVTTFDLTRALARGTETLSDIITKKVITTTPDEPLSVAARKLKENSISALPVIDNKRKVIGILSSGDIIQRG
ncbi:MAG TPA: CBS domain-containing protein, partial [Candidatus Lokiarchaeia archaeon]|nr:CBS domain-containing protein [Candidatus Lokiarchaeia archaeon]